MCNHPKITMKYNPMTTQPPSSLSSHQEKNMKKDYIYQFLSDIYIYCAYINRCWMLQTISHATIKCVISHVAGKSSMTLRYELPGHVCHGAPWHRRGAPCSKIFQIYQLCSVITKPYHNSYQNVIKYISYIYITWYNISNTIIYSRYNTIIIILW
jgi:hypothetical protein